MRTTKNKAQASASALSQKLTEAEAKLIEEAEKRAAKAEQPPPKPVIDLKKVANEPEAQVPRPKTKEVKSKEQGPSAKKRKRGELNIISDESDTSSSSDIDNDEPPVKTTKATKKTPVVATSTKAVSIDAIESRLESRLEARLESSLKSFLERLTPAAQPPVAKSPPQPLYQPPPPAVQQRPPIPQNSYPPPSYPSYQPEPHYGEPRYPYGPQLHASSGPPRLQGAHFGHEVYDQHLQPPQQTWTNVYEPHMGPTATYGWQQLQQYKPEVSMAFQPPPPLAASNRGYESESQGTILSQAPPVNSQNPSLAASTQESQDYKDFLASRKQK